MVQWCLGAFTGRPVHRLQGIVSRGGVFSCMGPQWSRRHILFWSDNQAVVHILLVRMSKVPCIMHLLHYLLSVAACFNFTFTSQHIPGIHNNIADALSHFHWQDFRHLPPMEQLHPVLIAPQLWELLIPPP